MRLIAVTAWLMLSLGGGSEAQESPPRSAAALDSAAATSQLAQAAWDRNTKAGTEEAIRLYGKAAEQYQRASEAEQQAQMLMNIAYLHTTLGRADTALARYRQLLRLLDETKQLALLGETLALIGEVHHGRGELDSAVSYYRASLSMTRKAGDRATEGRALSDIGTAYKALGRMDSALVYMADALRIRRELHDTLGQGVTLNNLAALLQILGDPDSALASLRESLVLRRAAKDRAGEATTLNNIAYSFERLKQPDSALVFYRQALAILQEMGQRSREGVTLSNMGRVFLAMERADSSRVYLERGLTSAREVGDHIAEGWTLIDLGRWYESAGEPDTALARLGQALAALRGAGDRAFEGEALFRMGTTSHRRSEGQDLRAAVAYYDSAAIVRAEVGRYAGADANRLSFAEQDVELFEQWGLAWLARAAEVGPDRAARSALAAAERGRAQGLLDLMRRTSGAEVRSAQSTLGSAPDLGAEGTRLAESVARSSSAALYYMITRDTLLVWLLLPSGEVTIARQPVGRDSLAALVGALRAGLGVDDVTDAEIAFRAVASLEEPRQRAAPRRGLRFAESAAQKLGELLLPPDLEERLDPGVELVIVPQGSLALIPFSVLPLGRSANALADAFGTTHPIRYAPLLAALSEAQSRPPSAAASRALIVGNPVMPTLVSFSGEPVRLPPLPSAGAEARWLAARMGARSSPGARRRNWR